MASHLLGSFLTAWLHVRRQEVELGENPALAGGQLVDDLLGVALLQSPVQRPLGLQPNLYVAGLNVNVRILDAYHVFCDLC